MPPQTQSTSVLMMVSKLFSVFSFNGYCVVLLHLSVHLLHHYCNHQGRITVYTPVYQRRGNERRSLCYILACGEMGGGHVESNIAHCRPGMVITAFSVIRCSNVSRVNA